MITVRLQGLIGQLIGHLIILQTGAMYGKVAPNTGKTLLEYRVMIHLFGQLVDAALFVLYMTPYIMYGMKFRFPGEEATGAGG
jgi:hypothetical protein